MDGIALDGTLSGQALEAIISQTVETLERSKTEIFAIAENARDQYRQIQADVATLQGRVTTQITVVDRLESEEQSARAYLRRVQQNPQLFSHLELRQAYERVAQTFGDHRAGRQAEMALREERDRLQRRMAGLKEMVDRAEALVTQVGVAMGFLAQNVRSLTVHLENAQQSRAMGIGIIKAQEEERRRVAREVHDGPAQLLANVVLRIDVCLRLFDTDLDRLRGELNQLKDLVRVSLQDVRKIIFDLRPMALDDLGLLPALRTYLKDFQAKTSIETELVLFGQERRLDSVYEVAIFRLVQEALHNVSKHARAARVWIKADLSKPDLLLLQVRDDGVGFDPSQVRTSADSGFGLTGMRERCDLLGGRMELESTPGNGTRLNFRFSLATPANSQS